MTWIVVRVPDDGMKIKTAANMTFAAVCVVPADGCCQCY
ncbi:hypothetical protein C7S15_3178 [Burkholderia cepacia]|nr:hypothetical protein [Burkholderia cepacia]